MTDEFRHLLEEFPSNGWKTSFLSKPVRLPTTITERYPWIPTEIKDFLSEVKELIRTDEKVWLLTSVEYAGESATAFAWNEWELLSIEAAGTDLNLIQKIRNFWDQHMPIALSMADGYSYYALRQDQTVVFGREPEFEETEFIANSYTEFLQKLDSIAY